MRYLIVTTCVLHLVVLAWSLFDRYLRRRCPKHGAKLHAGHAEVVLGFIVPDSEYDGAEKRHFPWAHSHYYTGCLVTDDEPKAMRVRYCPECRAAQADWEQRYRLRQ